MAAFSWAQEAVVEKSITGVQTGIIGIWINNELGLTKEIALRTEIGLDAGLMSGTYIDGTIFLLAPVITAEPRWYYNLDNRQKKGKSTQNNSGNFLGLNLSFHPDWFILSNVNDLSVMNQITIIPKWGIKRSIGQHFNYEAAIGLGYRHIFKKEYGYFEDENEAALDLHLRIGYIF